MEKTDSLNQELPFYLASPKHRFGGALVQLGFDITIVLIGAVIIVYSTPSLHNGTRTTTPLPQLLLLMFLVMLWSFFTWAKSQTPAHLVLKMRVYSTDTGKPATWRLMALRCLVIPFTYSFISQAVEQFGKDLFHSHLLAVLGNLLAFGLLIVDGLWIFSGTKNQRLTDVFSHTVVVNECEPNPHFIAETHGNQPESHFQEPDQPSA